MRVINLLCFLGLLLFSCKNNRVKHVENISIDLHPRIGTKYYYTITSETNTTLEVNEQKIKTGKSSEIGLIYEVQQDSAGNAVLKMTYDKFHIVLKDKDGNKETWDATNASQSQEIMDNLLNNVKGSTLLITLNPKGDILNIAGTQAINDKIMAGLSTFSFSEKKQVQGQLSQLLGEEFVKNNLQASFKLFPDSTVKVGSTWDRKSRQTGDLSFEADNKYILDGVDGDLAYISSTAAIQDTGAASADMFGTGAQVNITGKQTGNFTTDIKTGMLQAGKTITTIEGMVTVMSHGIPVVITMSKEISAKKID